MSRKLFRFGKKKASSVNNLTVTNPNLQLQEEARGLESFLATNNEYMNMLKRQRYGNIDPVIEATTDYQKALSFLEMAEYCPYENVVRRALNAIDRVIARGYSFYASDELEIAESSKIRLEELLQSCLSRENSRASSVIGNLPGDRDRNVPELDIAVQLAKGLPRTNERNQINQGDPEKTPEDRNQLKVEKPRSRLSDNYLATSIRDTLNPVDTNGRIDNEVLKPMAPAPWKCEPYDTEPARFNDYAVQWFPSKKTNDLRATNNTEYAYYLGPDLSQLKVEQDYWRPAWAREPQRRYWSKTDPTRGSNYAQPNSTTLRVQPE